LAIVDDISRPRYQRSPDERRGARRSSLARSGTGSDRKERNMGQPVVHFEVIGKDGKKLQSFYSELFE
jgi:hypothetical protein